MSFGKYSRTKIRKSSLNCCSKVNSFVFLAFCLVGLWMMISLSKVPVQNVGVSSQKGKIEMGVQFNESDSEEFRNNLIDLPEVATKRDNNASLSQEEKNSSSQEKSKVPERTTENAIEEKPEKKPVKESLEEETKSEDASKTGLENGEVKMDDESKTKNRDSEEFVSDNKSSLGESKDSEGSLSETKGENKMDTHIENKVTQNQANETEQFSTGKKEDKILNETTTWNWTERSSERVHEYMFRWKLCNVSAGPDHIPCLDNLQAIRSLQTTKHYEHRERHCPEEPPTCLLPLPEGYRHPIEWPVSRKKIWYNNVPHTKLAEVKGHQNWLKVRGDYHIFPGGGTQFRHGALHYIDFLQKSVPDIAWGKHSRVILDVGCGVASFGGFLFDKDVLTMSLAPKDEHEAQVQFALERGIPAVSAVMGTKRLPFPGRVFDVVHCSRCRVPWHIEGGKLLLELNRILRPGGLFVWSATPVYQKHLEDLKIWEAMKQLTKSMCWKLVSLNRDRVNRVGVAIYRKPTSNECYDRRTQHEPPLCQESDDPNAAWNVPLQACMHKVPVNASERGSKWPEKWPERLENPPYWMLSPQAGVYGKAEPEDFAADYEHWKHVVTKLYLNKMGISWSAVRNVMDMRSIYGGFAAALRDLNVWVMNVVTIDAPLTLPVIYERGLFGIYHDWCESFSTYPRSYDLLHADNLFSEIKKKKCNLVALVAEVDRILRPEGNLIVRDNVETVNELEAMLKTMHWNVHLSYYKDKEGLLCAQKTMWRPKEVETLAHAIA